MAPQGAQYTGVSAARVCRQFSGGLARPLDAGAQTNSAAATPLDQAHWKLKPPRCPVTSTTSPMKNNPDTVLHSIDLDDRASVSTPPRATSAVR